MAMLIREVHPASFLLILFRNINEMGQMTSVEIGSRMVDLFGSQNANHFLSSLADGFFDD